MAWVGYADESIIDTPGVSGAYILAAAVLPAAELADARLAVASLARAGRRFHWRDEEEPDRRKAVGLIADLPALHLVVVVVGSRPTSSASSPCSHPRVGWTTRDRGPSRCCGCRTSWRER